MGSKLSTNATRSTSASAVRPSDPEDVGLRRIGSAAVKRGEPNDSIRAHIPLPAGADRGRRAGTAGAVHGARHRRRPGAGRLPVLPRSRERDGRRPRVREPVPAGPRARSGPARCTRPVAAVARRVLGSSADTEMAHKLVGTLVGTGAVAVIGLLGRRVGGNGVGLTSAGLAARVPAVHRLRRLADERVPLRAPAGGPVLLLALRLYRPAHYRSCRRGARAPLSASPP